MSDRIQHTDQHQSLNELIATTTRDAGNPATTDGNTMAILASSHRVVRKGSRVSGGLHRLPLSARAAALGIQTCPSRP